MKLYCLSGHPNKPCYLLKFKGTTIMLDCGLDVSPLLHFLPLPLVPSRKFSTLSDWKSQELPGSFKSHNELKSCHGKLFIDGEPEFAIPELGVMDISQVDVILLSNYHTLMALPFITEYTKFQGIVYATEPTLHIGRLFMTELVEYIQRSPKHSTASKWKESNILSCLPSPLRDVVSPKIWRKCYNLHDIQSSLSKVQTVGFNQKLDIFGSMEGMAVSSGFCIGSSNWILHTEHEKIVYASGSSTLTTHPKPMEQSPLKNSDVLIMTSLTQTPAANPDAMMGEFCVNAAMTLKNGGNVLVPCYPSGVTYDLFECLSDHLANYNLSLVPMYFISPVADSSLAYSNIYSEWLSSKKQRKVYLPEPPFPHARLVKTNRLKHYSSIHSGFHLDMKLPCVVFTGHPSLRFGDVVHFLELWGSSSSNTLLFTEPDFQYLEALAPYQPLAMRVAYCPIDTSLSFAQANKLIKELKPVHLVVPEQYMSPPVLLPHRSDLIIEADPAPITLKKTDVINLPVKRKYERVEMDPELASSLVPAEVKPGIAIAKMSCVLRNENNKYILEPIPSGGLETKEGILKAQPQPTYVWGTLDVQELVQQLKQQGISDVKVVNTASGHIVHLPSEDSLIQIEDGSTHIICQGNEVLRIKLKEVLLKCLAQF